VTLRENCTCCVAYITILKRKFFLYIIGYQNNYNFIRLRISYENSIGIKSVVVQEQTSNFDNFCVLIPHCLLKCLDMSHDQVFEVLT